MVFQINPSKVPIWLSETEVRLGLEHDSQTIVGLGLAQERLLTMLYQPIAGNQLELVGASVGLDSEEIQGLIDQLKPSLIEATRSGITETTDIRFAEIMRIGFDLCNQPAEVIANRANQIIELKALDRTGLTLIKALFEVGFRSFYAPDYGKVERSDLGKLGYSQHLLGHSRIDAAQRMILSGDDSIVIWQKLPPRKVVRLQVLTSNHAAIPSEYKALTTAHIAVEYSITSSSVSKVVVPRLDPCLSCRDHWAAEGDPHWTQTHIQLKARHDRLDDASSLLAAVSLATRNICRFVDGNGLFETENFEFNHRTGELSRTGWSFHSRCDCRDLAKN